MNAQDALALYTVLREHGVRVWIDGGWGIDALLERQTRSHKDLDVFVAFDDLATMTNVLSRRGFSLKVIWSENLWLPQDARVLLIGRAGTEHEVATAFVLRDGLGREIDFHVMHVDKRGVGTPAWECNLAFLPDALTGHGMILGSPVKCLSAAMQMRTHSGYPLQPKDIQDLRLLRDRFGAEGHDLVPP
jgi:lincosamide nucleotidyltransferase A/C/D/E